MRSADPAGWASLDLKLIGDGTEALVGRYSRHAFEPHFHRTWAIGVALDRAHRVWCEGRTWEVRPGDAILIPPGTLHTGAGGAAGSWAIGMIFPDPAILPVPPFRGALILRHSPLAREFGGALVAALSTDGESGAVLEMATDLARLAANQRSLPPAADRRASEARARIDGWTERDFEVPALARAVGLHPSHLASVFRRAFGIGPLGYWLAGRIELARERLRAGGRPADVAHGLGFADQSHFTRAFRRAVGIPPGLYRRRLGAVRRGPGPGTPRRILEKF